MASKPQSTGSPDTEVFPERKRLTPRQTQYKKTEVIQYVSEYTHQPWIGLHGSLNCGWRRRRLVTPTSASNTPDIDWRCKPRARDPSQSSAWTYWLKRSTDWRVAIHRQEDTWSSLDTQRTRNVGGEGAERHRRGSICFATAASGNTSIMCSGRWWERPLDWKRADAGMCKSLSFCPRKNVIIWWWTSWQLLTSGSSRQN